MMAAAPAPKLAPKNVTGKMANSASRSSVERARLRSSAAAMAKQTTWAVSRLPITSGYLKIRRTCGPQ